MSPKVCFLVQIGVHCRQVSMVLCADDILESFLSEYRQKRRSLHDHPTTTTTTTTTTTSLPTSPHTPHITLEPHDLPGQYFEGQPLTSPPPLLNEKGEGGESLFSIPELPIGRELVINILSSWGDRFYVGLTSIEVYTASGQLANVKKVWMVVSVTPVTPETSFSKVHTYAH